MDGQPLPNSHLVFPHPSARSADWLGLDTMILAAAACPVIRRDGFLCSFNMFYIHLTGLGGKNRGLCSICI